MSPADGHDDANPYRAPVNPPDAPRPNLAPADGAEEVIQTIVPTRNAAALAGYYLGLFSIFPVLGLPMAVAGIFLGWKGLKKVRREPAAHGTAHAYVGLGCGLIGLLLNTLIVGALVVAVIAALANRR